MRKWFPCETSHAPSSRYRIPICSRTKAYHSVTHSTQNRCWHGKSRGRCISSKQIGQSGDPASATSSGVANFPRSWQLQVRRERCDGQTQQNRQRRIHLARALRFIIPHPSAVWGYCVYQSIRRDWTTNWSHQITTADIAYSPYQTIRPVWNLHALCRTVQRKAKSKNHTKQLDIQPVRLIQTIHDHWKKWDMTTHRVNTIKYVT